MKKLFSFILSLLVLFPILGAMAPAALAAEDSDVVITKSPGGEIVTEGEGAFFTAHAYDYTGLIWLIVSPDGETVYENNEAEEAFPGLEMAGFEGEELQLPAAFAVDHDLNVTWAHYGQVISDTPTAEELAALVR